MGEVVRVRLRLQGHGMPTSHHLRILFVEDHLDYQRLLVAALNGAGHTVEAVSSTKAALALAEKSPFDVVLCDYRLKDGSGADLMRELTRRYGLRGVCLSGYGEDELSFVGTTEPVFARILVKGVAFNIILCAIQEVAASLPLPNGPPIEQ